jgi:hypothetical protein
MKGEKCNDENQQISRQINEQIRKKEKSQLS